MPRDGVDQVVVGLEAVAGDERAARSIRSGSSENDSSGDERRAQPAGGEVGGAVERVDQLGLGRAPAPWR